MKRSRRAHTLLVDMDQNKISEESHTRINIPETLDPLIPY